MKSSTDSQIELEGKLSSGGIRSGGQSVTARLTENSSIVITFTQNVGMVSVIITDDSGNTAYSGTADSAAGQTVIPVSDLSPGTYTLTLSNAAGTMRGEFEI